MRSFLLGLILGAAAIGGICYYYEVDFGRERGSGDNVTNPLTDSNEKSNSGSERPSARNEDPELIDSNSSLPIIRSCPDLSDVKNDNLNGWIKEDDPGAESRRAKVTAFHRAEINFKREPNHIICVYAYLDENDVRQYYRIEDYRKVDGEILHTGYWRRNPGSSGFAHNCYDSLEKCTWSERQ